ncbi:MAG: asparagine synthase (glutamine-hydrolyzing) [Crocinitomicaceae bacterium]|nr:asparagine synthase (glutamine-hydrolyzing) [Crocinitomicaceae bacterium]
MCGITGFIDFKKNSNSETILKMTASLHHRGPDASGTEMVREEEATIGLGHARLSIIDLTESGKQPMKFQNYWICFNGEVYNFAEIKKDLIEIGHSFVGSSDTEVILHAYIQWGKDCISRFIGMFAFVIYNTETKQVFCVRDRAGIKPFFYYWKDGLFLFASELKAFHENSGFKKEINLGAVNAFMQYGNVPTPHCIFNYCTKLKPGHFLEFNLNNADEVLSNSIAHQKEYWNVYDSYNKKKLDISFEEAKTETEKLLKSACDYRMVADVPVGVFLSGGYDSASVTALLQKDRTEKLKTFTIGVPDIGLNEAPYAKDVAKYLGTDHTEINCTQKEALDLIPELPFYYDEPFADSSAIPTTLVSKAARKHVTVALSADAGDEVFAGYNRYDYLYRFGPKINRIPSPVRNMMAGMMDVIPSNSLPVLRNKYNFHNRYEKMKGILRNPSPESIMLSLSQQFTNAQLDKLMKTHVDELQTAYHSKELRPENYTPLAYMMAIDYQTYMVDDILQKVDRATMTVSLEGREPYLDHRVIEWAAQLPDDFKYHNGSKKYILKEITHNYLPKEMMDRPKMGFAIPIASWMQNDLRDLIETYINQSRIEDQGIFNWNNVAKIKDAFFGGKKENDVKLWYLLMFQMWHARWMEK